MKNMLGTPADIYGVKMVDEKLYTYGKTAHGSTPDKGVNALFKMKEKLDNYLLRKRPKDA